MLFIWTKRINPGIYSALAAAVLFGASTPLAKIFTGEVPPVALAGLLYLGSGIGLLIWWVTRRLLSEKPQVHEALLTRSDLPWLGGVVLSGGILGPVLLMAGLALTPAASASLLLNLEGVLTALLAWFVFKENVDRRIALGMAMITLGGILLSWSGQLGITTAIGPLAIIGACLCWAIDNNLTRKLSAGDPVQIAGIKGLIAGLTNIGIAAASGSSLPRIELAAAAGIVGFLGYGLSLVLFVLALRHVGAARTGAYFSLAPFVGVAISLVLLNETAGLPFWLAAGLMALGLWLHLS